jgi:branched-subunit amino acid ABC-type transport system permease component
LFFGLRSGMLVLVAIGLAITFGVMGVINMAHGDS